MPQRKQLSWSDLRLGVFVIVALLVIAGGVFYVTGGNAFTSRYRLVTLLPEVDGLDLGAPVTLDGVAVGNVDAIRVTSPEPGQPPNPDHSVEVEMRVNRDYQQYIRSDSVASLVTEGFLGNRVVSLQRGYVGKVLQNGDEVPGTEEKAMKQIVERGADLMQNLNALSVQVGDIVSTIEHGKGTLGKLLVDDTAYNHINDTLSRVNQIAMNVQQGQGTLGKLVSSDELYDKVDSVVGHVDNITAAVDQQKGSLGKLIYDPTFHDDATQFLTNSNALLSGVRAGNGTLGKLATDDSLFAAWRQTGVNLQTATGKLNSDGTSAGKFFSDPKLYDNITGLTGDLRLLVGEFRTNPKKFLHVKVSLF
jgi:phospholipid/cholesterol/gamma-HCH transport system substrate-binding protein